MDDYSKDWETLFNNRDNLKQNVKEKSVGRKPTKKKNLKQKIVVYALAAVLTISGVFVAPKIAKGLERNAKVSAASDIVKTDAQKILLDKGLAEYDDKGNVIIKKNSIEDYDKLDIDNASFEELYAYYLATGDAIEFGKLIQSVQGVDGVHNYTDISQFYTYNGFDKGSESGYVEWQKYAQDKLLEALQNGTIQTIVKSDTNTRGR